MMNGRSGIGITLVKIAALYLVAALVLGLRMAISHDHTLSSVHSHVALLGWATLGIAGLVYVVLPQCAASRLARVHFWLHNIGLPIMAAGLAVLYETGSTRVEPVVGLGSTLVLGSLVAFTINVLRNAHREERSVQGSTPPAQRL